MTRARADVVVSVGVPVFNGARYLCECLDSLIRQDYPAVEVIVVDDGSSDDSAVIAERVPGVRVVRREHSGLAETRNAAIEASTGPFVGFCDADDMWKPGKARLQAAYLAQHRAVGVVLCRQDTIFEPGVEMPRWLTRDRVRGDLDGVSPTSGLFRREVLEALGGFRTGIDAGTDIDLLIRARTAGVGIALIEESLRVRRIHDDNMTTRLGNAREVMLRSVRGHLHSRR